MLCLTRDYRVSVVDPMTYSWHSSLRSTSNCEVSVLNLISSFPNAMWVYWHPHTVTLCVDVNKLTLHWGMKWAWPVTVTSDPQTLDSERGLIQIDMVLRVAAARAPKTLAVWRLIWAVVASVIIAVAAHPAANAALTRYTSKKHPPRRQFSQRRNSTGYGYK